MGFGRTAEVVSAVSDSECWLSFLRQTIKILQGIFLERHKIVENMRVERKQRDV
jgi:hypothetical protein